MEPMPNRRKIYHISHMDNLTRIIRDGVLWSDAERIRRGLECEVVGMSEIKRRRLEEIEVDCNPGTMVGQYVPFYFCPRSVMLYILHMGNNPGLTYHGGQGPIVHLRADLQAVLEWAEGEGRHWVFSRGNAGAYYAEFFNEAQRLDDLNWDFISRTDWRDPDVKEAKQAELLIEGSFPWELIEMVGVMDQARERQAAEVVQEAAHQPRVAIERSWYY
jgi:ssDNA thymidine ADP-ribosyltransferase DarT-like protein